MLPQAAGRIRSAEQSARGQVGSAAKPAETSPAGNGQGTEARPAATSEGARHAAGGPRPSSPDDTADNVRID